MFRIDDPTAVTSLPPTSLTGSTPGFFSDGNPATGQAATLVQDWWLNQQQEELISILVAAGVTPAKGVNQVMPALRTLFGSGGNVAGNGWQKLPGGLILQWGSGNTTTGNLDLVNFPTAFPSTVFSVCINEGNAAGWANPPTPTLYGVNPAGLGAFQVSSVTISRTGVPAFVAPVRYNWIATGK